MTNEEKLLRAIGEIDEELIEEASLSYKKKPTYITHGLTVAASIVFVSAIILAASKFLPTSFDKSAVDGGYPSLNDGAASDNSAPPNLDSSNGSHGNPNFAPPLDGTENGDKGDKIECEYGYIYNVKKIGEYSIQFNLTLYSDSPEKIDFVLYGYNSTDGTEAICSSGDVYGEYDLELSPRITVNGTIADELPMVSGEYIITVDYSVIKGTDYAWADEIKITHFGIINE